MGHSIGISDSYYRITEAELLEDYLKAADLLTIGENNILRRKVTEHSDNINNDIKKKMKQDIQLNIDAIASLSDQILKMQKEIEDLKNGRLSTNSH